MTSVRPRASLTVHRDCEPPGITPKKPVESSSAGASRALRERSEAIGAGNIERQLGAKQPADRAKLISTKLMTPDPRTSTRKPLATAMPASESKTTDREARTSTRLAPAAATTAARKAAAAAAKQTLAADALSVPAASPRLMRSPLTRKTTPKPPSSPSLSYLPPPPPASSEEQNVPNPASSAVKARSTKVEFDVAAPASSTADQALPAKSAATCSDSTTSSTSITSSTSTSEAATSSTRVQVVLSKYAEWQNKKAAAKTTQRSKLFGSRTPGRLPAFEEPPTSVSSPSTQQAASSSSSFTDTGSADDITPDPDQHTHKASSETPPPPSSAAVLTPPTAPPADSRPAPVASSPDSPESAVQASVAGGRPTLSEIKWCDVKEVELRERHPFHKQVIFDSYAPLTVLKKIGKGGSCKVYQVMDEKSKFFALKKVTRSSQADLLYEQEVAILLDPLVRSSELIIDLLRVGRSKKNIYLLLELGSADLQSIWLAMWKGFRRKVEASADPLLSRDYFNQVRVFWVQILQAVQRAHEAGVIHADLKPANFLNVNGQLKLIDFGISRTLLDGRTHVICEGSVQGTLYYLPPELVDQSPKLRKASDVWSLGCILYQMTYGVSPFTNGDFQNQGYSMALAHLRRRKDITFPDRHPHLPNMVIPGQLIDVLKRCLRYNYKERPTIPDLVADLF